MDSVAQLDAAPVTGRLVESIEEPLRERRHAEHVLCALAARVFASRSDEVLEAVACSVTRMADLDDVTQRSHKAAPGPDRAAYSDPSGTGVRTTPLIKVMPAAPGPARHHEYDDPAVARLRPWDELHLGGLDQAVATHLLSPDADDQPRTIGQAAQDLDEDRAKVTEIWQAAKQRGQMLCRRYGWPQELVHAMVRLGHVATFPELVREASPTLSAMRDFTPQAAFGLTRIAMEAGLVSDLSWRRSGEVVILSLAEGNRTPDDLLDAAIDLSFRLHDLLGPDNCVPGHVALARSERAFAASGLGSVPLVRRTRLISALTPALAMSSRQEIYRRGLRFDLALRLLADDLSSPEQPSTDDLVGLVRGRFPAVGRVPAGPALEQAVAKARTEEPSGR